MPVLRYRRSPCRMLVLTALFPATVQVVGAADSLPTSSPASPPANGVNGGEGNAQGVSILSGGIGSDDQEEMRRSAKSFNVHVLFATRQGAYLADIPFTVTDQKGKQVAAAVSEGPWLYLKLPPGTYQITANRHGASQSRQVKVASGAAPVSVNFLFADQ